MKIYTIEEARELVHKIKPVIRDIKSKAYDYSKYHMETSRLVFNFRNSPYDKDGILDKIINTRKELKKLLDEVGSHSVLLRDIESGTIDIPSQMNGEEIFFCWKIFEEQDVMWWHGVNEHCSKRKPLKQKENL